MVEHNLEKYITYCITEGCCDRCADATMEEESPCLQTITLKCFMETIGKEHKKK